jgi:outer membrane protein
MRKKFFSAALLTLFVASSAVAAENKLTGVVNFTTCITDSKHGKKEQENLELLRKQMSTMMENTEKELKDLASKFEDSEYLDSLSPKAEEELRQKYQTLQEQMGQYQGQFYQVLNHANYQMVQKLSGNISSASKQVAEENHLDYVINKEACFYIRPDLDVTTQVISVMDKNYELDMKNRKLSENDETSEDPLQSMMNEQIGG